MRRALLTIGGGLILSLAGGCQRQDPRQNPRVDSAPRRHGTPEDLFNELGDPVELILFPEAKRAARSKRSLVVSARSKTLAGCFALARSRGIDLIGIWLTISADGAPAVEHIRFQDGKLKGHRVIVDGATEACLRTQLRSWVFDRTGPQQYSFLYTLSGRRAGARGSRAGPI